MAGCHDNTNGGNSSDVKHSVSLQFPDFLCDLVKLQAVPREQICRLLYKGHRENNFEKEKKYKLNLFVVQTSRSLRK